MAKTLRDKNTGQYAGSIGDGKSKVPTASTLKPIIIPGNTLNPPKQKGEGKFDSSPEAVKAFKETWGLNETTLTDDDVYEMLHNGKEVYYRDVEGTGFYAYVSEGFGSSAPQLVESYTGINAWPNGVDPREN